MGNRGFAEIKWGYSKTFGTLKRRIYQGQNDRAQEVASGDNFARTLFVCDPGTKRCDSLRLNIALVMVTNIFLKMHVKTPNKID